MSQGHSVYVPTVRDLAFRDLDGMHPPDLVIVADVQIIIDETEGAPSGETPPIPPRTMAMFCGRRGASPSCVEVTTSNPEAFIASHGFRFQ